MLSWLKSWLLHLVLNVVLKEIHDLEGKINFPALKAKVDGIVKAILPGTLFDDAAVSFVDGVLAVCEIVLEGSVVSDVLKLLVDGKFEDALTALKAAIVAAIPHGVSGVALPLDETVLRSVEAHQAKQAAAVVEAAPVPEVPSAEPVSDKK